MAKKSVKAFKGHHTSTNSRNVRRNQGQPGIGRYWRNKMKFQKRKEKRARNKKIRFVIEFIAGIGIMVGIILAIYIYSK